MKGYINVKLGGVSRGLKFGNRAMLDIMAIHDLSTGMKFTFDLMADLIYFSMLNNCLVKKEDPDFTKEDVIVWADEVPIKELTDIFVTFQKSFAGEDETAEPVKGKKAAAKK